MNHLEKIAHELGVHLGSVRYHQRRLTHTHERIFTGRSPQDERRYHLNGLLESLEYVQDDLTSLRLLAAAIGQ